MSIVLKIERTDEEKPEFVEFDDDFKAKAYITNELPWESTMYITRYDQVSREPGDFQPLREDVAHEERIRKGSKQ